jgi:phosphate starvation-inducible protein PhoH
MRKNISDTDSGDAIGMVKPEQKKRTRKPKKQNTKELLNEYHCEIEAEKSVLRQRSIYENSQYLSATEKERFDSKFTAPKNESQELYTSLLKHKNKKIVVATGPAGTGKTLFATEYGIRNFLN